jgi:UrcA family protein
MRSAILAATVALGLAIPAQASSPYAGQEIVTVRVSHSDLDLASASGLATLNRRVQRAVREACDKAASGAVVPLNAERDCRTQSLAAAKREIESRRQQTLALLTLPRG